MIGIQKQTKSFSLGTFLFVFFLALSFHFNLDVHLVYADSAASELKTAATAPAGTPAKTPASGDDMGNPIANGLMTVFKGLLYGILVFLAFIASVAAWAFLYVLDVSHLQAIMGNPVVWEMWKIVRDFFNLFFIFGLLLVAFSTIFQVSKFGGLKSVWSIVLAALFINFSFPIARMMIDVGNVMMYSFLTDMFGMTGESLTKGILGTAGLADILVPDGFQKSYELKYYLIAIVCMFMFATSFMTLAFMMLLRLVWLPILVMFSPLGFAGSAIPGMSGFSKQWWDRLIKNVFFGPIAVFMMLIAVKFLATWGSSDAMKTGFSQAAISSSTASGTLISGVVYMTIPIIFFWIAITSAESMSSQASGIANSFGSKFLKKAKDWGMNRTKDITGYSAGKRMVDAYSAERAKRGAAKLKDSKFTKWGESAGKGMNNALDKGRSKITIPGMRGGAKAAEKRYNKRQQEANEKDIADKMKELQDSGLDRPDLIAAEALKNPVTRDDYIKRAAHAGAYNRLGYDERQNYIATQHASVDALLNKPAVDVLPAHLKNDPVAVARYTADQQRAQVAYTRVKSGNYSKQDMSFVSGFVTDQMKQYVNAGSSHGKTTPGTPPLAPGMNNQTSPPPPPQNPSSPQTPPSSTWTTSPGAAPPPPPQAPPSPPPLSNP